jgi:pilus assembly protein CpaB
VAAAFVLTRYMDARTAAARVPTVKVVVAAVDIPVATRIKPEWLASTDWPAASQPAGTWSDPRPLAERIPIVPISKGEPVLASKLAEPGATGGLASLLPPGMRAAAVAVDDVVGVAGFVHPGDRVDVVVTMQARADAPFTSKVILQNVKVLAVGKDVEHRGRDSEKPVPATVATLMVTPEESERLALGASKGKLLLTLRGLGDDDEEATRGVVPTVLLAAAEPPRGPAVIEVPRARPTARRAPPKPPAREGQIVEILRGDLYEQRDFARKEKP